MHVKESVHVKSWLESSLERSGIGTSVSNHMLAEVVFIRVQPSTVTRPKVCDPS